MVEDAEGEAGKSESEPQKKEGIVGTAFIQAVGNVIGGYLSGRTVNSTELETKINSLKDSNWFHWVLFFGVAVIAIGAFIGGVEKIFQVVMPIFEYIKQKS